jgi:hypothetical protein
MTPTQTNVIGQLKDKLLMDDAQGSKDWEYKRFHVQEYTGEAWCLLWTVTGHKDDAGTLAELLYRKERLIWIGPRGRILVLNQDDDQKDGPELLSLKVALREPARRPARQRDQQGQEQHQHRAGLA